jgi:hypothetical protein
LHNWSSLESRQFDILDLWWVLEVPFKSVSQLGQERSAAFMYKIAYITCREKADLFVLKTKGLVLLR